MSLDPLCISFLHLAVRTWDRMRNNHNTRIWLREDGITALNLQDLLNLNTGRITVKDFSPYVEAHKTGADWEWWFIQPGKNFGAAVQAKSLSRKNDYDIGKVTKSTGVKQIDRILQYSSGKGITPMYCFYNWWALNPNPLYWPCRTFAKQDELWGCSLANGHVVKRLDSNNQHSLIDIHRYTMPWHCIACCKGHAQSKPYGAATKAQGIASQLSQAPFTDEGDIAPNDIRQENDIPEPQFHDELPDYIQELRRITDSEHELNEDILREIFDGPPPARVVFHEGVDEEAGWTGWNIED